MDKKINSDPELKESPEFEKRIGIWFYSTRTEGIGGVIKTKPSDFFVREITNRVEGEEGKYLIAALTKENWDTHSVIREISRRLRVSRNRIGFAGTKDKFAVTTQKISIWGTDIDKKELERVKIKDASLKIIGRANKAVSLGDLYGNEFEIVIRSIEGRKEEIKGNIEAITTEIENAGGVPNFFGVQRFGIRRPITHVVGKYLIKGEIKEAVMSYISDIFPGESEEAKRARLLCKEGKLKELKECLKRMPPFLRYEKAMLNELVKSESESINEANFLSAFSVLPKNLQKLFVHAYQAYLFNLVLSNRMKQNLPFNEALIGDVVCFRNEFGFAAIDKGKVEKVTEDKVEGMNRLIKRGRAFVTAPIFGYETEFGEGAEGEIERKVLDDGCVELNDFYIEKIPEISSKGTRRPILVPVKVKLSNEEVSNDDMNPGRIKAKLNFFLPKGSYATVVLREYMKRSGLAG
ncbi:MAG: tRNA pseudouridine(13) synthase TruD [Methanophagales archaeon]|nr:tRNA pseudouridine(13) synthase TruD [Methanophagales archaeon]